MADNGVYTNGMREELGKERSLKYSERFLAAAHPGEVAAARYELDQFKGKSEPEQLTHLIEARRGNTFEMLLALAGLAGMFGAGALMQSWFPYQYGKVPILPSVIGTVGLLTSIGVKRSASFRYGLAMSSVGLALGGGTVSGSLK